MWIRICNFILRNRIAFLVAILGITAFLGWHARKVAMSYDFPQVIPTTDPDLAYYNQFRKVFGEDGDLLVIGFGSKDVFSAGLLNDWYQLGKDIKKVEGVKGVAGIHNLLLLERDTSARKFTIRPIHDSPVQSQAQADSLHDLIMQLPFYKNIFYNDSTHATLMAVKLDSTTLRSKDRVGLVQVVSELGNSFAAKHNLEVAYTGLPYIRTTFAAKLQRELNIFLIISVVVTAIILFLFFRSGFSVILPLIIIGIIIVWTLGFTALLGYRLTMLTALIPPLIVIIAVPNFIYFLSRYHTEYRKYGNKLRGIIMMVNIIAVVVFLNNLTTAIGFGVLVFIDSPLLREFGILAFFMITATYIATLIVMPVVLSFMPDPKMKHTNYMSNPLVMGFINGIIRIIMNRRPLVFVGTFVIAAISLYGVSQLRAVGYILDDVPKGDKLAKDLRWFEDNFKGVMPFEITIDTHEPRGVLRPGFMSRLSDLQDSMAQMPEFSTTISLANLAKYATQAYYNGDPEQYRLPGGLELTRMQRYLSSFKLNGSGGDGVGMKLSDSTLQVARVTAKMKDIGSEKLILTMDKLKHITSKLFPPDTIEGKVIPAAEVKFTGFSAINLKGNGYLIEHLAVSLVSGILLVMLVIFMMFPSLRLVLIVLLPNLLAMIITAGLMGYFRIPLKPSSILVFSTSFGLAVDTSFHFLAVYRRDLRMHNWSIPRTVALSLRETGTSIVYTNLILLFGFGIFCFSSFGSTVALGSLTAITIFCATFTNLVLIPTLLVSFDRKPKRITRWKLRSRQDTEL